jgi:Uma2 family endonuclease
MASQVIEHHYSERKLWTRDEVARLSEIFPDQRYELIEGELIDKMGQNPPHAYVITMLNAILTNAFPGKVRVQSTITLPDPEGVRSEPLPDIAVVRKESSDYFYRHPGPQDIALLIEVADTSLQIDRVIKARLYARCGIELYWVVDIPGRRIIVYRNPGPDEYNSVTIYQAHDRVPFEEMFVSLDQIFPAQ